jgi:ribokinase
MPTGGKTALTIGGAMIDTIVVLENSTIERISLKNAHRSYLMLEEGQKADANFIAQYPGGGAVNTAVSLARLGFLTSILAKLGCDENARIIRETLAREGISLELVAQTETLGTGSSVLVLAHDRNAAVFTYRGANGLLSATDLPPQAFARELIYIARLSNASAVLFPTIVESARSAGAYVVANPGARQLTSRSEDFWGSIGKLSMLSVNSDEATLLLPHLVSRIQLPPAKTTAIGGEQPWLLARGLTLDSLHLGLADIMRLLLQSGAGTIVITDGARGAYAASGKQMAFCPALPTHVRGTTGAGDAFSSTFAAFASAGHAIEDCLRYATVNAAAVLQAPDAQSTLLAAAELELALKARIRELPVTSWPL